MNNTRIVSCYLNAWIGRGRKELTFDTTAAMEQRTDVPLDGADADELVAYEVSVVRRRNVVVGKRPRHVMPHAAVLVCEG